jgi:hypothetical protein
VEGLEAGGVGFEGTGTWLEGMKETCPVMIVYLSRKRIACGGACVPNQGGKGE